MSRDWHEHGGITVGMKVVRVADSKDGNFLTLRCDECEAVVHLHVVEARFEAACDCHSEGDDQEQHFTVIKAPPDTPIVKRSRAMAEKWAKDNGFANLEAYFETPAGAVWRDYDFDP